MIPIAPEAYGATITYDLRGYSGSEPLKAALTEPK